MSKPKPLDIPATLYGPLRAVLQQAAPDLVQDHHLDLTNLRVTSRGGTPQTNLVVTSLLSSRTKTGMVELALNTETTQMSLDKTREVLGMLQGALEAAISDQMLYAFLTTRIGLSDAQASAALADFRELRQGSKEIVHPH